MAKQSLNLVLGFALVLIPSSLALKCWKCSSETDATCRDYFNTTRVLLNQRHMDSYYYGNVQAAQTEPQLIDCAEQHSYYGELKSVCLKWVYSINKGPLQYNRECRSVRRDFQIGSCPEDFPGAGPRTLEACSSCDYDGCNSASFNSLALIGLVPSLLVLLIK